MKLKEGFDDMGESKDIYIQDLKDDEEKVN